MLVGSTRNARRCEQTTEAMAHERADRNRQQQA